MINYSVSVEVLQAAGRRSVSVTPELVQVQAPEVALRVRVIIPESIGALPCKAAEIDPAATVCDSHALGSPKPISVSAVTAVPSKDKISN